MPSKPAKSKGALTKSDLMKDLAAAADLPKKDVERLFEALGEIVRRELVSGPGVITVIPGMVKIKKVSKPARPARMGLKPGTNEKMMFKAKKASLGVKCSALKGLKDVVQ